MATETRHVRYCCSDDCDWGGCPGHDGTLRYQSASDAYTFTMNGRSIGIERGELEAMISLLVSLDRADSVDVSRVAARAAAAKGIEETDRPQKEPQRKDSALLRAEEKRERKRQRLSALQRPASLKEESP